jgi:hypothetical protein
MTNGVVRTSNVVTRNSHKAVGPGLLPGKNASHKSHRITASAPSHPAFIIGGVDLFKLSANPDQLYVYVQQQSQSLSPASLNNVYASLTSHVAILLMIIASIAWLGFLWCEGRLLGGAVPWGRKRFAYPEVTRCL